jgi:hypothetical protein
VSGFKGSITHLPHHCSPPTTCLAYHLLTHHQDRAQAHGGGLTDTPQLPQLFALDLDHNDVPPLLQADLRANPALPSVFLIESPGSDPLVHRFDPKVWISNGRPLDGGILSSAIVG